LFRQKKRPSGDGEISEMRTRRILFWIAISVLTAFPLSSGAQWVNLGGPGGSGIQALAASGSYLFAGTAFGVFVSTDDGGSWKAAGEIGPAVLGKASITSLVISGLELWACTSSGVFRSTDYAAHWTSVSTELPRGQRASLLEAGAALYLCPGGGGVRRSTNGGTSWIAVGENLFDEERMTSLTVLGETVYAGIDCAEDIYRSRDGGATWTPLKPGLPDAASVRYVAASGGRLLAGTAADGLFMIEDGGDAWTPIGTDWGESVAVTFLAASGPNVLAGIDKAAFLSTDSGASWKKVEIGPPPDGLPTCFAVCGPRLFIGTAGAGLFRSDDLGLTWARMDASLPSRARVVDIARIGKDLFAATGNRGGVKSVFTRADGGAGWEPAGSGLPEEGFVICLKAVGTKLLAGTNEGIFFSENRGRSWRLTGPGQPEAHAVLCFEVVGRRVVAGSSAGILLSSDQGRNWAAAQESPLEPFAVYSLEALGTLLFAGTSGGLFMSRDGGGTWDPVVDDSFQGVRCSSIAAAEKALAVAIYPRKKKSAGEEPIVDRDDYPGFAISCSTDGGLSWNEPFDGLPEEYVVGCLAASGPCLIAPLEGRPVKGERDSLGIFLSRDGGVSWTSEWPGQWKATPINRLLVEKDGIYAATAGAGVWRLPLSALKKPDL
jgi:photosystem II stability/assembly factor-like uncharacterized protein